MNGIQLTDAGRMELHRQSVLQRMRLRIEGNREAMKTPFTRAQIEAHAQTMQDRGEDLAASMLRQMVREREDHRETLAMWHDKGATDALSGEHYVHADDGIPLAGQPGSWCEKPFARIVFVRGDGDPSVGIPGHAGWQLAADQTGTVVADLLAPSNADS